LAAEKGYGYSQFLIAQFYFNGHFGLPKDKKKSLYWLMRSAEQGYQSSFGNLAGHYSKGWGVKTDPVKAYFWLTIAMENSGELSRYKTFQVRKRLDWVLNITPEQKKKAYRMARRWL